MDFVVADGCEEEEEGDEFGLVEKACVVVLVVPGGTTPTTRMPTTPNQRIPTRASIFGWMFRFPITSNPDLRKGYSLVHREEYGPHTCPTRTCDTFTLPHFCVIASSNTFSWHHRKSNGSRNQCERYICTHVSCMSTNTRSCPVRFVGPFFDSTKTENISRY